MSSSLYYALTGAEQLIADSPAFQARIGAGITSDDAKGHIRYFEGIITDLSDLNNTLADDRPIAVLNLLEAGYTQFGQGDGLELGARGGVLVHFQANPAPLGGLIVDAKAQYLDFLDYVGQVIDWIAEHVGTDQPHGNPDTSITYFPFRTLMQWSPVLRPDFADRNADDFFCTDWIFTHEIG